MFKHKAMEVKIKELEARLDGMARLVESYYEGRVGRKLGGHLQEMELKRSNHLQKGQIKRHEREIIELQDLAKIQGYTRVVRQEGWVITPPTTE
jgi:hypothetical protein